MSPDDAAIVLELISSLRSYIETHVDHRYRSLAIGRDASAALLEELTRLVGHIDHSCAEYDRTAWGVDA